MKKIHFIGIAMIGLAIFLLINAAGDVSSYATFAEARANGQRVKVAGQLSKDKAMHYAPEVDPNYFSFHIKDGKGEENKVVLLSEKPQDFELSEQVVLTGKMEGDEFVATELLMKCPSKYKDEEIYLKSKE